MPDAFVKALNEAGYQAVFMPTPGAEPPELYHGSNRRLIRWGPLADFSEELRLLRPVEVEAPALRVKTTTRKGADAAGRFLADALQCIGVPGPTLDLGFLQRSGLVFTFEQVRCRRVDPSKLVSALHSLPRDVVPQRLIDSGELHVAFEYLYASKLLMTRVAARRTEAELAKHLDSFLEMRTAAEVAVERQSTISFTTKGAPAAFAYKAGRLLLNRTSGKWEFYPETINKLWLGGSKDEAIARGAFVPVPGAAIRVEQGEPSSNLKAAVGDSRRQLP